MISRNPTAACILAGATLLALGCQDDPLAPPTTMAPQTAVNGAGRLAVYNAGVDRSVPASPCSSDLRHRQLDFWVGEWNVGSFGATNIVERLLDGCVIAENWSAPNGSRGRSISSYDADADAWRQTWVSQYPDFMLRMSGGLNAAGQMVMDGTRTLQPLGIPFYDEYTWTGASPDEVIQSFVWDYGPYGGGSGALTYLRAPSVTPLPAAWTPYCAAGGPADANRLLDFFHGTWTVSAARGPALGTASVAGDLTGCLTEERYTTPKGYGAVSFIYYDLLEERWFRTYVDSEGERVELAGAFTDGALVLTGEEPGPTGRTLQVRNRIMPGPGGAVRQTWETSEDGSTWRTDLDLTYTSGA